MIVGDLVQHPGGMVNVCRNTYSKGLILEIKEAGSEAGRVVMCLVLWGGEFWPMLYRETDLRVISEASDGSR